MAVRPIVLYPDPLLKKVCRPVSEFTPEVLGVCQDLVDTLRAGPGVGLAAPQIGVDLRLIAVDVTPRHPGHGLLVLANPRLLRGEGFKVVREGCLSIPEYTANVGRHERVVVEAVEPGDRLRVIETEGFEAVCLQHEIDHLDGILFLDRVTSLRTDVFRRKGAVPRFALEDLVRKGD
jgi:peptide deformylase